jgi:hypothetical protein
MSYPVKYRSIELGTSEFEKLIDQFDIRKYVKMVTFIEEVINPELRKRYDECQLDNERIFFHGTNPTQMNSIEQTGLRKEFNTVSAYGKGNYFSPDIMTSYQYMKFLHGYSNIYVCTVKLGKFGVNHNGNNNNIYVAFEDNQSHILYRLGIEIKPRE